MGSQRGWTRLSDFYFHLSLSANLKRTQLTWDFIIKFINTLSKCENITLSEWGIKVFLKTTDTQNWIKEIQGNRNASVVEYLHILIQFSTVQSLSGVQLFVIPWTAACQASLSITNSRNLLKLLSIESVMPSNHLILSSPSPPAFNVSQHQGPLQWVTSLHQVAKVLQFQFQH